MSKIIIEKCPYCGSKRISISRYSSQIWVKRTIKKDGTLGKEKIEKFRVPEIYYTISCEHCGQEITNSGYCISLNIDENENKITIEDYDIDNVKS